MYLVLLTKNLILIVITEQFSKRNIVYVHVMSSKSQNQHLAFNACFIFYSQKLISLHIWTLSEQLSILSVETGF